MQIDSIGTQNDLNKIQNTTEASSDQDNHARLKQSKVSNTNGEKDTNQQLLEAIEKASGKVEIENKGLEFAIHKETNQIIIRIVNKDTEEIIKELPSEKILDMIAKMVELSGNFINEIR